MNQRAPRIGIFGGFDVQNYGDLLFPLIAEAELSKRLASPSFQRFSYHAKALPDWPYAVTSLAKLPHQIDDLSGVLIGGGDIIRFDTDVAPGYGPPDDSIHHPTGFWLHPLLLAMERELPIAWNAPGVCNGVPAAAGALMELAIGASNSVCVRDTHSRDSLLPFAGETDIAIVPDTVWGLAQLLESPACELLKPAFELLKTEHGLHQPYIVVQANERLGEFARFVRAHRRRFAGYRIVVLPVGAALGEESHIFSPHDEGFIRLPSDLNPLLIAQIIRHARAVVGVSLHFSISALAFGVPLFRPGRRERFERIFKYDAILGLQGVFQFDSPRQVHPRLFLPVGQRGAESRGAVSPDVTTRLELLHEHWDRVALTLLAPGNFPSRGRALERFHRKMPGFLDNNWSPLYAARMRMLLRDSFAETGKNGNIFPGGLRPRPGFARRVARRVWRKLKT